MNKEINHPRQAIKMNKMKKKQKQIAQMKNKYPIINCVVFNIDTQYTCHLKNQKMKENKLKISIKIGVKEN